MVLDFKGFMRQRAPRLTFGDQDFGVPNLAPQAQGPQGGRYNNWNQVANAQESTWGGYTPASQMPSNFGMEYQQAAPPVIGQPTPALASIVAPQAPLGTGQSGQEQVAGAGVIPATTTPGWAPPNYDASKWQQVAAGAVRNGWGLDPQGARQNNGIVLGNGVTLIMPTDYNYAADTYRANVAGAGIENGMQRAIRWTADEMSGNPNLNPMQVFAKNIRRVMQESGGTAGFDMTKIGGQGMGQDAGNYTPAQGAPPAAGAPAAGADGSGGGAGAGGGGGGGGAGTGDDAREFLMEDPRAAFRELMRRRGYSNMDGGGYAMQFLQSRYEPALQSLAQVASGMGGEDAIANETFDSFLNKLQNGSLSRFAKDTARQAYGDSGVYRADAGDEANQKYYENLNYLNTLGSGGLVQRSEKNRLDRYMNQYGDIVYRTLNGEKNLPMTFEEFMRQNNYSVFR
jgi:hypothetical protein